jgi:hypothetical protein
MKISVVSATWKRFDVFLKFINGIKLLDVELCLAVSEQRYIDYCQKNNIKHVVIANDPLATKMNAALQLAKGSDYVLFLGSDDIVSPNLFEYYKEQINKGIDFIGCLDWYFYDIRTKQSTYWGGYRESNRKGVTCGAGRVLSKRVLDLWNWKIWEDKHSHILDNSFEVRMNQTVMTKHIFKLKDRGMFGLDIKSDTNMTPFKLWDNTSYIDSQIIYKNFPYLNLCAE